jgi:hypothetical protein
MLGSFRRYVVWCGKSHSSSSRCRYYSSLRVERSKDIEKLPETQQMNKFVDNVKRDLDSTGQNTVRLVLV